MRAALAVLMFAASPAVAQSSSHRSSLDEWAPDTVQTRRPGPVRRDNWSQPAPPAAGPTEWEQNARFFGGIRTGVGIPPGGRGVAPTMGFELGVAAERGFGFGLHLLSMLNPPSVPALNIPRASYGIGAAADLRLYFQSIEPLTLYGTLSAGFLAGPSAETGVNVVLPMLNPGFGARVKVTDTAYVAFEFGAAGGFIPFVNLSLGWEPPRVTAPLRQVASAELPQCAPANCPPSAPQGPSAPRQQEPQQPQLLDVQ